MVKRRRGVDNAIPLGDGIAVGSQRCLVIVIGVCEGYGWNVSCTLPDGKCNNKPMPFEGERKKMWRTQHVFAKSADKTHGAKCVKPAHN